MGCVCCRMQMSVGCGPFAIALLFVAHHATIFNVVALGSPLPGGAASVETVEALWIRPPPEPSSKSAARLLPIFVSSLNKDSHPVGDGVEEEQLGSSRAPVKSSSSALSRQSRSGDQQQLSFTVFRGDFSSPNYGRLAAGSRDNFQVSSVKRLRWQYTATMKETCSC